MNSEAAVCASHLCKTYRIYAGPGSWAKEFLLRRPSHDRIEALRDVSFDLPRGRSLGVIGDNGAGKTTLLKLLAGTTFPTSGDLHVSGRVSALLELGSGFHPEFTGRENVLFSGALAGYNRLEVDRRLDQILAFSELGDFVDRPVKTYSSGMFVRLGFSVATGFDPQVLIIDESLAVGDQTFQKKCTDRIVNFKRSGVTIVFCSHNLHQVKTLCDEAVWLKKGEIAASGPAIEVSELYQHYCRENAARPKQESQPSERALCWIEKTRLSPDTGGDGPVFSTGDAIQIDIQVGHSPEFESKPAVAVAIVRSDGEIVYVTATTYDGVPLQQVRQGLYRVRLLFPELPLLSGRYSLNVVASDENSLQAYDILEGVHPFRVKHYNLESGIVRLRHHWETSP